MLTFSLTKKAKQDLVEIARYTEEHWGVEKRNAYLRKLDKALHHISENSTPGHNIDDILPGYRRYLVGRHTIFFRKRVGLPILVVRVLHQRMDPNMIIKIGDDID